VLRTRPRVIEGDIIIVPLVADMDGVDAELFTLGDTGKAIRDKLDGDAFRMKSQTISLVSHVWRCAVRPWSWSGSGNGVTATGVWSASTRMLPA